MALVHNNLLSVFAGVSKQSLDLRLPNNCEEMINIYPTVHNGLRRRNPTVQLSSNIITENNQFLYSYDRGLAGETEEQYVITIDKVNGLKIFDIKSATYRTVSYSGSSLSYLESSNPELGFSAITIKDTTFITNRDIVPMMIGESTGTITMNTKTAQIGLGNSSYGFDSLAPSRVKVYRAFSNVSNSYVYAMSALGSTTTIIVDGISIVYTTSTRNINKTVQHKRPTKKNLVTLSYNSIVPETVYEYSQNLIDTLQSHLDQLLYRVVRVSGNKISIQKLDGTSISVSSSISYPTSVAVNPYMEGYSNQFVWSYLEETNISSDTIGAFSNSTSTESVTAIDNFDKIAFVWIRQVSPDPAFPYTFTVTLKETSGTVISSTTSAATTTSGVASAISTWASSLADFTSQYDGSVVKIVRDSGTAFEIVVSDTYGNQASIAFKGSVTSMDDLPKSFPFKNTIIKVDGIQKSDDIAYWIKYDGNSWIEYYNPNVLNKINKNTMPHKITRNADFTFTIAPVDYNSMLVGDYETNPVPDFIGNPIRDVFFVNSRLGFLTRNGISLSQQGEFTNFFRTTVLTLLDDSAITTYIDSNKSVGLEYATELNDAIVLFGDKQQFFLDASKGITPSNLSVSSQCRYEINKNVRPISHGDSVYFIAQRGSYSSLMKMDASTLATSSKADDISSHVPEYIDADIIQIVGSMRNQVIFLKSRTNTNIIYVYKSHMVDRDDKQKSWSKWEFSSDISSIFAFDRYLYLFGSRYNTLVPTEEFTFVEYIDFNKNILFDTYISYGKVLANPSLERIDIDPYSINAVFIDNGIVRYNSEIELSEWSLTDKNSVKELRGSLLIKTILISSSEDSNFFLEIEDKERGTTRSIPALYTVDRKPYVSGNSKNIGIKIKSTNGSGFQINSISLEGQYNNRSTRTS